MHDRRMSGVGAAGVLVFIGTTALAAPPAPGAPVEQAKTRFQLGEELFSGGDYRGAIEQFKAAEALAADPAFDYDIATCYRKLGDLDDARSYVLRTLKQTPEGSPYHERATAMLGEIDEAMASQPTRPTSSRPSAASSLPSTMNTAPVSVQAPAHSAPRTPAPAAVSGSHWYSDRTGDWIAGTGTVVLLAGVATLVAGEAEVRSANSATDETTYRSDASTARTETLAGAALSAAGAGVLVWGLVHCALYQPERAPVEVSVTALPDGAALSAQGWF